MASHLPNLARRVPTAQRARWLRPRSVESPSMESRRPMISTHELERLYTYGTLLRVR